MKRFFLVLSLCSCLMLSSCGWVILEAVDSSLNRIENKELFYVNMFGRSVMRSYYLWCDEIIEDLENWNMYGDPEETVRKIRYKDENGNDIDRWSQMFDNYTEFTSRVAGTSTTYGFDFQMYYANEAMTSVVAVVTYLVNGGPAEKAGLKRGDCITELNGKSMTPENYLDVINDEMSDASVCTFTFADKSEKTMSPVTMYKDPVAIYKTFDDAEGGKIGYLLYNSFTLRSYERLMEAFSYFKAEGVSDLILDMRYNGGGYVEAEMALASMIAPENEVKAGSVFEKMVYNEPVTEVIGCEDDCLRTEFSFTDEDGTVAFSTEGCNPGIKRVYAILGPGSASASESLLVGLMPYMPVTIIGEQSHGKFCSGIMLSAQGWYNGLKDNLNPNTYAAGCANSGDWGIYVMIARYADKNGETPCMPNGFKPDIAVKDNPQDGFALGDPEESMLAVALAQAGYVSSASRKAYAAKKESRKNVPGIRLDFDERLAPESFGKLVRNGRGLTACPVSDFQYSNQSF